VDSVKVIEGGGGSAPAPPFERMEGASGITVAVPLGRPQKQTGRFLFALTPPSTTTTPGTKRPRDDTEDEGVPSNEDIPMGGVGAGTMVRHGDGIVDLEAYNRVVQSRYAAPNCSTAPTPAHVLSMELARTECVRAVSKAMDASIITSFVAGSALNVKIEAALMEMAGGAGLDAAQRASTSEYIKRVFAFAAGVGAKKKVTITPPTGLFPALVFECLSAPPTPEGGSTSAFDPILPSPAGRGLGGAEVVSNSIRLRLVSFYHDLLNRGLVLFGTGDKVRAAAEVCARVASMHLCGVVDGMYPTMRTNISSAAATAAPPSVTVAFYSAKGLVCSQQALPEARYVVLVSMDRRHELTLRSYRKLRYLYTINANNSTPLGGTSESDFHMRLFALLERYFQLLGSADNFRQEGGWHAAIPLQVLGSMSASIGVDCEGFSNPFNVSSRRYCSAFPDTDCWFGSCGSFFDLEFVSGAIEVNPPFDHSVAVRTAQHINKLLEAAAAASGDSPNRGCLRFIVVVPTGDSTKKSDNQEDGKDGKDLVSAVDFVGLLKNGGYLAAAKSYDGLASPFRDGCEMAADGLAFVSRFSPYLAYLRSDVPLNMVAVQEEAANALTVIQREWSSILLPTPSP
jgi:hypothetical protein